ncbi:PilZ domain-containing protein [Kaarinaea lacus]
MEHRCSVRLPVAMDVLLYHNNVPVVHCKTRNIGADGMFVRTGSLKFGTNTMLKVEFKPGEGRDQHCHMMPALVVHHANDGMGLMFPGGDSDSMKVWRNIVRHTVLQNSIDQVDALLMQNIDESPGLGGVMNAGKRSKFSVA